MLDYYKQKQFIARVDRDGKVLGEIEKWEAHRKGILHKALTIALIYQGKYVIQHRKHPAFDKSWDVTSSSHQLFINGVLQTSEEAALECLKREWKLEESDLMGPPQNHGPIYYKAKDPKSEFTEHELCDILIAEVKNKPIPNLDFAYGMSIVSLQELLDAKSKTYKKLAPWVKKMIEEDKL